MVFAYAPQDSANYVGGGYNDMKIDFWVDDGCVTSPPSGVDGRQLPDRLIFQNTSFVKVELHDNYILVKWTLSAGNWSSLFYVMRWLQDLNGPVILQFFNSGWFREKHGSTEKAIERIDKLIANSDIRLSARTYIQPVNPSLSALPPRLRKAWDAGRLPELQSVVCEVDHGFARSKVSYVGPESAIAKVWGLSPVSYPCQNGHSYDRVVSQPYFDVVKRNRPHHDHVLAAMAQPDGEVTWFSYQRLIVPGKISASGMPTVEIMSEPATVEISVL